MLEPREADVPVLFLVLVVLPLVAYVLLGKWSEAAKKRERISLLAQLAAEDALRVEAVPSLCARCFAPATTRCSRCKSVRYCSGKCQIIHWRQVHKQECQQLEKTSSSSSSLAGSVDDSVNESLNLQLSGYNNKQGGMGEAPPDGVIHPSMSRCASSSMDCSTLENSQTSMMERTVDKRVYRKSKKDLLRRDVATMFDSHDEILRSCTSDPISSNNFSSKEAPIRHKSRTGASAVSSEESLRNLNLNSSDGCAYGQGATGSTTYDSNGYRSRHWNISEPRNSCESSSSSNSAKYGTYTRENELDNGKKFLNESIELNGYCEMKAMNPMGTKNCKSAKSCTKVVGDQLCLEKERKGPIADESKAARVRDTIPAQGSNGVSKMGIMKMMGLRKSTKLRQDSSELRHDQHRKLKMLFPYEEFLKLFQYEVIDLLSPRGLLNCGNSCYANAVLQCLTCTKPLVIYLLRRSHSSACCGKDWCLMCELEQHVMMLRESGGPLSPGRILSHMRSISCQIGDGSQEDAHEFLRLLVASMQSICLERHGGESKVDPRLQETTFIQHTFGGRLWSKVKCLRCSHESERYENIMDLTLEIYGWVESLEDALTQFTSPEDLDGENMYKCARCATYVRARKQLSIHEAPNILTIVLKRFQEGRYGKINKCITFPEMLDMMPFMTGTGDTPPLYMLYSVVVHLDTQNASFSGHYVSYIKDMQGTWFRIDDMQVHPVPMSQVMSEGAYMLFYMRSCPRPRRTLSGKAMQQQVPASARHSMPKSQRHSRQGQSNPSSHFVGPESFSDLRPENNGFTDNTSNGILRWGANKNMSPVMESYAESPSMEFSDVTSSDWSLFTSSDEASFTTESARDSFSTVDYADGSNGDPFCSIYGPESASPRTVCCRTFSSSKPQTRFVSEKGYVLDSYLSTQSLNRAWQGENLRQVIDSSTELSSDSNCGSFVNYGSNQMYTLDRTSGHCNLRSWDS
ncbi:hypothetical protein AB3S75_023740 [Citrus x aurantiifolia]